MLSICEVLSVNRNQFLKECASIETFKFVHKPHQGYSYFKGCQRHGVFECGS